MKTLLTILLISVIGICKGQSDTSYISSVLSYSSIGFSLNTDTTYSAIMQRMDDKTIEVIGDTMAVIKLMLESIRIKDSTIEAKDKAIAAAVNYTNHVSDYFKNEKNACGYNKYQAYLKKNGYTTKTTKRKIPCN